MSEARAEAVSAERGARALSAGSVWRLLGAALLTFLLWRGSLALFDLLGLSLTPNMGACRDQWQVFGKGHEFLNGLFRWDASWYLRIARRGYTSFAANESSEVAFYPLLPYLARYLGLVVGGPEIAGLLICNLATLGCIFYLRALGALLFDDKVGRLAVLLLLVFPSSLFLSAFYTESLFICCAAGAMVHFFRGEYLWCGLLGFLAMLTRSTGLALFAALALHVAWRTGTGVERFDVRTLFLLLIPGGLGVFMWMLAHQVGDPLAFTKVMGAWGRHASWPWEGPLRAFAIIDYTLPPDFSRTQRFIDGLSGVAFFAIGVAMAVRRYPVALWAFVVLGTLVPLSTYNVTGMNRYVLGLFPAFLFLARACQGRPELERWLVFSFGFFLAIYSLRFMQCGWAG